MFQVLPQTFPFIENCLILSRNATSWSFYFLPHFVSINYVTFLIYFICSLSCLTSSCILCEQGFLCNLHTDSTFNPECHLVKAWMEGNIHAFKFITQEEETGGSLGVQANLIFKVSCRITRATKREHVLKKKQEEKEEEEQRPTVQKIPWGMLHYFSADAILKHISKEIFISVSQSPKSVM